MSKWTKCHCKTTKGNETYFQEQNLQLSNKISLHHAISIISMASKMAEADLGPLNRSKKNSWGNTLQDTKWGEGKVDFPICY